MLYQLLIRINSSDYVTLEEFLEITGERGRLILCMILATPFLIPISIPGSSIPFGIGIMFIGISIIFNKSLIPKQVLKYKLKKNTVLNILKGSIRVLNKFERIFKHRAQVLTGKQFYTHNKWYFASFQRFFAHASFTCTIN